ncbi:hypothetical protein MASR2M15_24850 [Anaerolineales bacterium]
MLRFTDDLLQEPRTKILDVRTQLKHFALINYAIPVERVRPHVDARFELDAYQAEDGKSYVWVSVVPFEDVQFHFVNFRWLQFHFGQTNYRTYIIDRQTGERGVWFFGTVLGGWPVIIPRYIWRLPWHYGKIRFDCVYDTHAQRYSRYQLSTDSDWANLELELEDTGKPISKLKDVEDLEDGLVRLTHPLLGVYYRNDGTLGQYRVWHDRLHCTEGQVKQAKFNLLMRLGLFKHEEEALQPHSVFIQHQTEFIIQLPPQSLP